MKIEIMNKGRVPKSLDPIYGSDPSYGFTGAFQFIINGMRVKCIACDQEFWQHVSVSIADSKFPPSWDIMCKVKDVFWEDEECVLQYHPPKSDYVNTHPGVLHMWRPLIDPIPMPPKKMV